MTRFLCYLGDEVPCNFLVHSVKDVSRWWHALRELNITHITEVDCKDQFNKILPHVVLSHMADASQWLAKRCTRRAKELVWSIQREHKQLDRAGQGAPGKVWYLNHDQLEEVLRFEMIDNIYLRACGKVWGRTHCIPMGGSFSAQSADLHSCWGAYKGRRLLRSLGELCFTELGFPFWRSTEGVMTKCQFRDNILLTSSYPDSEGVHLIQTVCELLGKAWDLKGLCDCQPDSPTCQFTCHKPQTTAIGFCLARGPGGEGLAYLHPNALVPTVPPSCVCNPTTPQLGTKH